MTKIYFMTTVFSRDPKEENKRQTQMRTDSYSLQTKEKLLEVDIDPDDFEPYFLGHGQKEEVGGISKEYTKEYTNMVKKGTAIRDKIQDIITNEGTKDGFLLFMDGDGQIPFDSVFTMINILKQGEGVVMACRGRNRGIHLLRDAIEQFELFLLSEKYKIKLFDGQCGCWGFKTHLLHTFPLTATAFDIELNILLNSLDNKIPPAFFLLPSVESASSDYQPGKEDAPKMEFIASRLMWTKDFVMGKCKEFIERGNTLPPEYVDGIKGMDWPYIEKDQADKIKPLKPELPFKLKPVCYECETECEVITRIEK